MSPRSNTPRCWNRITKIRPPGMPGGPLCCRPETMESSSAPPNGDGAANGARPGPQRVPVVAGFDHPLTALLTDDLADMVRPDHDGTDADRPAMTPMAPVTCQVVARTGIAADKLAHLPATPRRRPPAEAAIHGVLRIALGSPRGKSKRSRPRIVLLLPCELTAGRPTPLRLRRGAAQRDVVTDVPVMVLVRLCRMHKRHCGRYSDR